jgi:AraC-like DNA-binding protein
MQIYDIQIDGRQHELTQHGTPGFPLAVYRSEMDKFVLGYTPWHWHEELQFCLVLCGSVCFRADGRELHIPEGGGIYINSGILHMAKPEAAPDSTYLCLDAGPVLLRGFAGSVFEEKYVRPCLADPAMAAVELSGEADWQRKILTGIADIFRLNEEKGPGCEYEILIRLLGMWLQLMKNAHSGGGGGRGQSNAAVQDMLRYIEENYGGRITVEDIAGAVSFSASECCRMFRRVTGETIFSYLNSYRLERGAVLLRSTALPVTDIAYETGFCSASYFIKQFKKLFSVTPRQYRDQLPISEVCTT